MSLSKMTNLLDILSDPNKKTHLNMLLRCEEVLERMDFGKVVSAFESVLPYFGHYNLNNYTNSLKIEIPVRGSTPVA